MNPRLVAMLVLVGGAGAYLLYSPQPSDRTMTELRDGGIMAGQPVAVLASEKDVSRQTANRVRRLQGADIIRPKQRMFRMLRTARCFGDKFLDGGFGNCVRVDGGSMAPFIEEVLLEDGGVDTVPRSPQLVIPSLRQDLDGGVLISDGGADDAGESDEVDDAQQVDVTLLHCVQVDAMVDAGQLRNPYANRFCAGLNRLSVQVEPCMIPNGWRAQPDGGTQWCEEACGEVDCKFAGPYALSDGGARWAGFNALAREYASGADCVPVACTVQAGDVPSEWL